MKEYEIYKILLLKLKLSSKSHPPSIIYIFFKTFIHLVPSFLYFHILQFYLIFSRYKNEINSLSMSYFLNLFYSFSREKKKRTVGARFIRSAFLISPWMNGRIDEWVGGFLLLFLGPYRVRAIRIHFGRWWLMDHHFYRGW